MVLYTLLLKVLRQGTLRKPCALHLTDHDAMERKQTDAEGIVRGALPTVHGMWSALTTESSESENQPQNAKLPEALSPTL